VADAFIQISEQWQDNDVSKLFRQTFAKAAEL
jgi:hypothetical protein